MKSNPSTVPRRRVFCVFSVVCCAAPLWAEEVVPNSQCTCAAATPDVPWYCFVQTRCIYEYPGDFVPLDNPWPPPEGGVTDELTCNNCRACKTTLDCSESLCVTVTDEASVNYGGSFSVEAKGTINRLLATGIEITTTGEFHAGRTSTTSVSTQHCIVCGSSDIPPCAGVRVTLTALEQERRGMAPLYYRWEAKTTCVFGGGQDWHILNECPQPAFATITGRKGFDSGCIGEDLECGVCPNCPGPVEHGP